jgi:uncharacterized protein (DUF58 family)
LPLPKEGLFWLFIAGAMLVTGLVKGINLINLLACFVLALFGINVFLARRQLRSVRARRVLDDFIFAGVPFSLSVHLDNAGRRPAFGLTIEDHGPQARHGWFVAQVGAGATATMERMLLLPERGPCWWGSLDLVCGHPFGLVALRRHHLGPEEVLVFPRLGKIHHGALRRFLTQFSPALGQAHTFPRRNPTAQTEFHGLRSFRPGDSPRWIHWRTSARRGELMVREFEDTPNDDLVLIVEPWLDQAEHEGENHREKAEKDRPLELLLSLAATICWDWCRQKGDRFVLVLAGAEPSVRSGNTGRELAREMLSSLARVQGTPAIDDDAVATLLENTELPTGAILHVTTRGSGLARQVSGRLHRAVASIHVARGEYESFFEL